jgi:hypothetical protein
MQPESETPVPQQAPPPAPETHWIVAAITARWPAMKKFIVHVAFLAVGALAMIFLYEKFIIPGKDAEIGALQQQKEKMATDLQREDRENDKLRNDVAAYQSSNASKSFPLKKRAQILAKQLTEFADSIEGTNWDNGRAINQWSQRFESRANVMLQEMDELGEHSEKISQVDLQQYNPNVFPGQVKELAKEIDRLAVDLPDVEKP